MISWASGGAEFSWPLGRSMTIAAPYWGGAAWAMMLLASFPDRLKRVSPPPQAQAGQDWEPRTTQLVIWPDSPEVKASVARPLWMKRQLSIVPPGRCWTAVEAALTKMQLRMIDGSAPLPVLL